MKTDRQTDKVSIGITEENLPSVGFDKEFDIVNINSRM